MARPARELFDAVTRVHPDERAAVNRLLIDSDDGSDEAWRIEVERRASALGASTAETIPREEMSGRLLGN